MANLFSPMDRLTVICSIFVVLLSLCHAAENTQMVEAKLRKEFNEKLSSLTVEGQKAAKSMLEVFNAKLPREETQSLVEELMEGFSEKVKKELESLRPMRNGKVLTMEQIFEMIEKI